MLRACCVRGFLQEIAKYLDFGRIATAFAISFAIGAVVAHVLTGMNVFLQLILVACALSISYIVLLLLFKESFIQSTLIPIIDKTTAKLHR